MSFERGKFRVRGDCVEIVPSYEEFGIRIEFWGDEIEQVSLIDPTSGEVLRRQDEVFIYPAKHFVLPDERINNAIEDLHRELEERLAVFRSQGKLLEAQRLSARTRFDLEMLQEVGYCPGIENYSRPLAGRPPGSPPDTLYSFFPTISCCSSTNPRHDPAGPPSRGRRSRKTTLVNTGSACPAAGQPAADVRGMGAAGQPGDLRLRSTRTVRAGKSAGGRRASDRPTGLLDPSRSPGPC